VVEKAKENSSHRLGVREMFGELVLTSIAKQERSRNARRLRRDTRGFYDVLGSINFDALEEDRVTRY
jgi:hypothetical protein